MKKMASNTGAAAGGAEAEGSHFRLEKKKRERGRLDQKLSHIRHKIMVMSGKGGVGKSMVTINLAVAMAIRGYQVGILDGDIHGPDVPKMLGIEKRHLTCATDAIKPVEVFRGLKAVSMALAEPDPDKAIVWRGPLKHAAIKQFLVDVDWGELDFLFIDLPPLRRHHQFVQNRRRGAGG